MKKIVICMVCALMSGVARADLPLWKVFVGGNIGYAGAIWTSETKTEVDSGIHTNLATSFVGGGVELGAKYAKDIIYNFGASLVYDYIFDSKGDMGSDTLARVGVGFSDISLMFDNYFRLFKKSYTEYERGDLMLGVGIARITERVDIVTTQLGKMNGVADVSDDDYGTAVVFKVGYNGQLNQYWDWYISGRWFMNLATDRDFDSLFTVGVGVKYNF